MRRTICWFPQRSIRLRPGWRAPRVPFGVSNAMAPPPIRWRSSPRLSRGSERANRLTQHGRQLLRRRAPGIAEVHLVVESVEGEALLRHPFVVQPGERRCLVVVRPDVEDLRRRSLVQVLEAELVEFRVLGRRRRPLRPLTDCCTAAPTASSSIQSGWAISRGPAPEPLSRATKAPRSSAHQSPSSGATTKSRPSMRLLANFTAYATPNSASTASAIAPSAVLGSSVPVDREVPHPRHVDDGELLRRRRVKLRMLPLDVVLLVRSVRP